MDLRLTCNQTTPAPTATTKTKHSFCYNFNLPAEICNTKILSSKFEIISILQLKPTATKFIEKTWVGNGNPPCFVVLIFKQGCSSSIGHFKTLHRRKMVHNSLENHGEFLRYVVSLLVLEVEKNKGFLGVVEPTHLKHMLVKMGIFPNIRGENKQQSKPPRMSSFLLFKTPFFVHNLTSFSSPRKKCC